MPGWSQKLATPAAAGNAEQRFNLTTDFDFIYTSKLGNMAIECKKVEDLRLPLHAVKDHQEEGLLQYLNSGQAYILVNFRLTRAWKNQGRKAINRAFAVHIADYLAAKKKALAGEYGRNRKSLRLDWFADNAMELDRIKGHLAYWDLSPLFKIDNGKAEQDAQ